MLSIRLILVAILFVNIAEAVDICEILDSNFCFFFADSTCYVNLCKCDACSKPDKVVSLLEDSPSNSTTHEREALCPSWCSHLKSDDAILNILSAEKNKPRPLPEISFKCEDLKKNCINKGPGYNGYCYFYDKYCEFSIEVSDKMKTHQLARSQEQCVKYQKKCSQKYKRHYSCRAFRRHCKAYHLPELEPSNSTMGNSTEIQVVSPLEQCLNFQKICSTKYRKHFACRQYHRKCKEYNLPEIHFKDSEVTQKPSRAHKKHMRKGHGMRHNETIVVTDGLFIGNETLVETILRRN